MVKFDQLFISSDQPLQKKGLILSLSYGVSHVEKIRSTEVPCVDSYAI